MKNDIKSREATKITVDKVVDEAKATYIEAHGTGSWEELSQDEKYEFARGVLEKYYDPEKKGYTIK